MYFYNVGDRFYGREGEALEDWAKRFGMGKTTGIDIPGESEGRVPTPEWKESYFETEIDRLWKPGDSINLSVGQGDLTATPLQLAVTYAAVANGGKVVTRTSGSKWSTPPARPYATSPPQRREHHPTDRRSTSRGVVPCTQRIGCTSAPRGPVLSTTAH